MAERLSIEATEVTLKVGLKQPLTKKENMIYLTEIVGLPVEEAERIIAIDSNKDPLLIVD